MYFHDFSVKNYLILYAKQSKLGVLRNLRRRNTDLRPRKTQTPERIENTDPPKNSDPLGVSKTQTSWKSQTPWVYRKHRPPEKLRSLGVSKTQTSRKTQSPWVYRKHRPPEKLRPLSVSKTQTPPKKLRAPECMENTVPLGVSKTQTPRVYRKHRPPKNSEPWMSWKHRPLKNSDPPRMSRNVWMSRKIHTVNSIFFKYYNYQ